MEILTSPGTVSGSEPDIAIVWPGDEYELNWRIRNTGKCSWDSAYSIQPKSDPKTMAISGIESMALKDKLTAGEALVVQYIVVAPLAPGDYPITLQLLDGYNKQVGPDLSVLIRVPADSQNQPLPTLTANPNVQFRTSRTEVAPGERVVLEWEVKQAKEVYFYPSGHAWQTNPVPLKGAKVFYPIIDTAYNLRVVNSINIAESYKIEVEVTPPMGLPDIKLLEISPKGKIHQGICVDISWTVRGGLLTEISLYQNDNLLLSNADRVGEYTDCPTDLGSYVYELHASGPAGLVCKSRTIYIIP
jgi:hypothetical protein